MQSNINIMIFCLYNNVPAFHSMVYQYNLSFYNNIVGFSFGGILAQLCDLYLWSLSQGICPELLERNLLCITFGQPMISLPKIAYYADRIVDKNRFHAIYISDDKVPTLLSYLDPGYIQNASF